MAFVDDVKAKLDSVAAAIVAVKAFIAKLKGMETVSDADKEVILAALDKAQADLDAELQ